MTDMDCNEAIREVTFLLGNEASRKRAMIKTDLASDLPRVQGDRVQLQQVLVNLIMNALDAIVASSGGPREILIRSIKEEESVVVSVEDAGTGLDLEQIERIFEPFFTSKSQGIGMGLTVSRSIVQAHGGTLSASGRAPHGARFSFTLPAGPVSTT